MAAMTVVEGYAEHVMDAVGESLDPGYAELRRRLERDRQRRGPLDAIVSKLLGPGPEDVAVPPRQSLRRRGRGGCWNPHPEPGLARTENLPSGAEIDEILAPGSTASGAAERRFLALFR